MSSDLAFPERGLRLRYGGQSEEVLRVGQALLEADYARDPLRHSCSLAKKKMNDHFWPSIYPGMIIGGLVGLTFGGFASVLVGVAGGTAGATVMYLVSASMGMEDSIASLVALIGGATGGSYAFTSLYARLARRH